MFLSMFHGKNTLCTQQGETPKPYCQACFSIKKKHNCLTPGNIPGNTLSVPLAWSTISMGSSLSEFSSTESSSGSPSTFNFGLSSPQRIVRELVVGPARRVSLDSKPQLEPKDNACTMTVSSARSANTCTLSRSYPRSINSVTCCSVNGTSNAFSGLQPGWT